MYMYMYVYTVVIRKKTPACKLKDSRGRSAAVITVISLWESLLFFRFPAVVRPFFSLCIRLIYLSRVSTVRRRRSPYFFVIAEFGKLRFSDRTVYAAVMGYRIHKCRVRAAPRALLRKGAKRARRQLFAYPTRRRPRSFRRLKVGRRIRTPVVPV